MSLCAQVDFLPEATAYPGKEGSAFKTYSWATVRDCFREYHPTDYTIVQFTSCLHVEGMQKKWHALTHFDLGGGHVEGPKYNHSYGDFRDASAVAPLIPVYHASTVDMVVREWQSQAGEEAARQFWGLPYQKSSSYCNSYPGVNGGDIMSSAWPFEWQDLGWTDSGSEYAGRLVTHTESHCCNSQPHAPYVYIKYSKAPLDAPGTTVELAPTGTIIDNRGSSTTTTGPLPRAASMARRSMSIRRRGWCWCASRPSPRRRTGSSIPPLYQPIRPWRTI